MSTSQSPVIFVHLSDIHFREEVAGQLYDRDRDVRNQLERDLTELTNRVGTPYGIVVGGDIAFKGASDEYAFARAWLTSICHRINCPEDAIWTVPGNHDVNRAVVDSSPTLQNVHHELRNVEPERIDDAIEKWCTRDMYTRTHILQPIEEYNRFAAAYGCDVSPERPTWYHDVRLNDGSTLRLLGLNSTLASDGHDNDGAYKLVLGSVQSTPPQEDGVEYLVMCHHPPSWLRDQDEVEQTLDLRTRIQLFGHKHTQRITFVNGSVRIASGAMHPERRAPNWRPTYNVILVSVVHTGDLRSLRVEVFTRVWSGEYKCFVADRQPDGSESRIFSVALSKWEAPVLRDEIPPGRAQDEGLQKETLPVDLPASSEGGPMINPARRLTYRFLSLPHTSRLAIAQKLQLLREEDEGLRDRELFARFFQRARENQLLDALWSEVESEYPDGHRAANPFAHHQS
jgi:3',5'-cyclic AMP phosphodiesterase CpdA